jgi:hypothetical protein
MLATLLCVSGCRRDRSGREAPAPSARSASATATPSGSPGSADGYVLFAPLLSGTTYLINKSGEVVHTWESDFAPAVSAFLLDNGHLLRPARQPDPETSLGGEGGRIQEFDWNGRLAWEWVADTDRFIPHHDLALLPNGNVLLIAWQKKTREEAIRAGKNPRRVGPGGLWPDCVLEVRREGAAAGRIAWEWHAWDHLVQDRDARLANYGKPSEHPELVDINGSQPEGFTDHAIAKLKALGYLAGRPGRGQPVDFMHTNSVAYNSRLDQIALSVWTFNEVWILDHGTTTGEAAAHAGGRAGRGGDLLYRWGNPQAYGRGVDARQQLFGPHDARWVPEGYPRAGNLTVFNNGAGRGYSSVIEIESPVEPDGGGRYSIAAGLPFGPKRPVWEYAAADKSSFFAEYLSGAQRLPNGNTLVCDGPVGRLFEVTPAGRVAWEYESPFSGDLPNPVGDPPRSLFRATFVPAGHPALAGRDLPPMKPQPAQSDAGAAKR